ncbi:MAG: type II toxin-antitoxin system RelE/ParE family toxin [Hydrogenophaga sp.]|uniref:type II toxin-antitoxin system RelE/ParE family toxin n=1 Tax=Hydrogenophaga sp. TaxID=1904254 RepID=UPI0025C0D0FA|nr:type II toxin-antitoxin system RelE/ParE family toxin [Hydrogenophaga sp.]MBT9554324.1 type II toxin-antitoxin system RelE/ParE family toxin [Hydrogenophaga sp.]
MLGYGKVIPRHTQGNKNIEAAKRVVQAMRKEVKALGQQPGAGRHVEDMPDEFREWLIDFGDSGYVARYHVEAELVVLLAVRHQKEAGF